MSASPRASPSRRRGAPPALRAPPSPTVPPPADHLAARRAAAVLPSSLSRAASTATPACVLAHAPGPAGDDDEDDEVLPPQAVAAVTALLSDDAVARWHDRFAEDASLDVQALAALRDSVAHLATHLRLDRKQKPVLQILSGATVAPTNVDDDLGPLPATRRRSRHSRHASTVTARFPSVSSTSKTFLTGTSLTESRRTSTAAPSDTSDLDDDDEGLDDDRAYMAEHALYPGMAAHGVPTLLPNGIEAVDSVRAAIEHRDLAKGFRRRMHALLTGDAGMVFVTDVFWWCWMDRFQPNTPAMPALFDRIAATYVKLLLAVPALDRDEFAKHFPDLLAESTYTSLTTAFPRTPMSDLAPYLADLLAEWTTGIVPYVAAWPKWRSFSATATTLGGGTTPSRRSLVVDSAASSRAASRRASIVSDVGLSTTALTGGDDAAAAAAAVLANGRGGVKKPVTESHPTGPSPPSTTALFDTYRNSPLVAHHLRTLHASPTSPTSSTTTTTPTRAGAAMHIHVPSRTPVPPGTPTYRDVLSIAARHSRRARRAYAAAHDAAAKDRAKVAAEVAGAVKADERELARVVARGGKEVKVACHALLGWDAARTRAEAVLEPVAKRAAYPLVAAELVVADCVVFPAVAAEAAPAPAPASAPALVPVPVPTPRTLIDAETAAQLAQDAALTASLVLAAPTTTTTESPVPPVVALPAVVPAVDTNWKALFISDVQLPDGSEVPVGDATQVKAWRLRNVGHTAWPATTLLVHLSGEPAPLSPLYQTVHVGSVAPGHDVTVSVPLAPLHKPGRCLSYWRLAVPCVPGTTRTPMVDVFPDNAIVVDGDACNVIKWGQRVWCDVVAVERAQEMADAVVAVVERAQEMGDAVAVVERAQEMREDDDVMRAAAAELMPFAAAKAMPSPLVPKAEVVVEKALLDATTTTKVDDDETSDAEAGEDENDHKDQLAAHVDGHLNQALTALDLLQKLLDAEHMQEAMEDETPMAHETEDKQSGAVERREAEREPEAPAALSLDQVISAAVLRDVAAADAQTEEVPQADITAAVLRDVAATDRDQAHDQIAAAVLRDVAADTQESHDYVATREAEQDEDRAETASVHSLASLSSTATSATNATAVTTSTTAAAPAVDMPATIVMDDDGHMASPAVTAASAPIFDEAEAEAEAEAEPRASLDEQYEATVEDASDDESASSVHSFEML
ncbi:hypothetical protein GGF32_000840 [Allomyces javanicus]|nr:hypothetical protein GGF32_000840 [Allomyces javanicus]